MLHGLRALRRNLPAAYVPYDRLVLCSNILVNVLVPIAVDDFPVFLLGKTESNWPCIWLGARDDRTKEWGYVIERNDVFADGLSVSVKEDSATCVVTYSKVVLARISVQDPAAPEITYIFLRPVGLDVTGNKTELHVGTNRLLNNSFVNVTVALALR